MNKNFAFITSNKNKAKEIKKILGTQIKVIEMDIPEIQSLDLDEVVTQKAKSAFNILNIPVAVEDVSFEIDALNGLPGTFIKFFIYKLGSEGTAKLIKSKNRKASVTAAIALFDGSKTKILKGVVKGSLTKENQGQSGFDFDRIFIPDGFKNTYAEMSTELKNKISHRSKALSKLKKYLQSK